MRAEEWTDMARLSTSPAPLQSPRSASRHPNAPSPLGPLSPPRARGEARFSARRRGTRTVLATLRHGGSAKALFPRRVSIGPEQGALDAVLLNTAGGVTGGDRFVFEAAAASGAWLRISTQAAERAYRAAPNETGQVEVRLRAEAEARLDWLPQETILFDGAAIRRRFEVDLAAGARLLAVEPLIYGRTAMGEEVRDLRQSDQWRVRCEGRLVYADALRLEGDAAATLDRPGVAGGARALATLLFVAPEAAQKLEAVRAQLPETAGASLIRDGVLAARFRARDGLCLRRALLPTLRLLAGAALPTVWTL